MAKAKGVEDTKKVGGLPEGARVTRRLTLPALVLNVPNATANVQIMTPMRVSTYKGKAKGKANQAKEPATVCTVGNFDDGAFYDMILSSVVKSHIEKAYPKGAEEYVGKCLSIQNLGKKGNGQRKYWDYGITEFEPKNPFPPLDGSKKKK